MKAAQRTDRPVSTAALLIVSGGLGLLATLSGYLPQHGRVALVMLLALLSGVRGLRTD